jgi:hypothetical protein
MLGFKSRGSNGISISAHRQSAFPNQIFLESRIVDWRRCRSDPVEIGVSTANSRAETTLR